VNQGWFLAFDQRVEISQKIKRLDIGTLAGSNGRAYSADIISKMGSTGSGDAG
jgi:hypothetical protein